MSWAESEGSPSVRKRWRPRSYTKAASVRSAMPPALQLPSFSPEPPRNRGRLPLALFQLFFAQITAFRNQGGHKSPWAELRSLRASELR